MSVAEPVVIDARALLLDMDGTLVNSDAVVERIWRRWAETHGLDGDEVMQVVHGRQGHASMAVLLPDRPVEQNLADNARMLAQETADTDGVVPIPGAPDFLTALAGVPHALVTSADVPLSTARMAAAGLPLPALRITAESVGASKPDPEGFLKAAAELGIAPADCVVFEDSGAGIQAGKAAGMRVVGVGERAAAHPADVVVRDLREIAVEVTADGVRLHVRGARA
ncbi:HAD-IA family hydrolase [Streptomyces acidiscabies]|uniref:HAD-IA family hydrolase n=1 Tax=Streptomyces acidiscabies TaxID=42234 RepID=A0AAP6B6N2_9ACTN|nr:HAD-IA family hydrolase [Streptomyces acidiscabies]MBP5939892.1 HAD-IA family hydrolase [Streptomyces sp. LBUM 1476]MBZ3911077.1 HAD-IA family hydrolase [Streptomyces acidiscabies]MDX2959141.1 HAD-IA family hydrolase [Streptomyces acidiscabies]MDX3025735.1 HAD-IA family hydrolase [Streptomyces acidiscabies]MDX3788190.1 HAD-IA family hydrolase [Streptomyces acidiscabies]